MRRVLHLDITRTILKRKRIVIAQPSAKRKLKQKTRLMKYNYFSKHVFSFHPKIYFFLLNVFLGFNVCFSQIHSELSSDTSEHTASKNTLNQLFFEATKAKYIGDTQKAIELFTKITTLFPNEDAAYYELASLQLEYAPSLSQFSQSNPVFDAKNNIQKAIQLSPTNVDYISKSIDINATLLDADGVLTSLHTLSILEPNNEEHVFKIVDILIQQKKYTEALDLINQFIEREGDNSKALITKINLLQLTNKIDDALQLVDKLIAYEPNDVDHYMRKLSILLTIEEKTKDSTELYKEMAKVYDKFPKSDKVLLFIFSVMRTDLDYQKSYEYMMQYVAIKEIPLDEKLGKLGEFMNFFNGKEDFPYWEKVINYLGTHHTPDAQLLFFEGEILRLEAKYPEAKEKYEQSLQLDNTPFATWFNYILVELFVSDYAGVIQSCNQALLLYPSQAWLYYFLGSAQIRVQQPKAAVQNLGIAINFGLPNPSNTALAYSMLGEAYQDLKEYELSDRAMEQSINLDPENATTLNNYAYFLSLREQELEQALQMAKKAVALEPDNASFEDTMAWILFKKNKFKQALHWIEKALKNTQEASSTLFEHYGDILFKLKKEKEAVEYWNKALQLDPNNLVLQKKVKQKEYVE